MVSARSQSAGQNEISPEEYEVYNAAFAHMFAGNKVTFDFGGDVSVKVLRILAHTSDYPFSAHASTTEKGVTEDWREQFPGILNETVDNYGANNKASALLKRSFNLPVDYIILTGEEIKRRIDAEKNEQGWHATDGLLGFSRVGFDRDRRQALVYMTYHCGSLCGHGYFLFLTKAGGAWKVQNRFEAWIS